MLDRAAAAAATPDAWMNVVFDLGRNWAWQWWNVLLPRPTRQGAGVADMPVEAVPDQLWRLLGRDPDDQGSSVHVPWLTPAVQVIRTTGGMALDPGSSSRGSGWSERVLANLVPGFRVVPPAVVLRPLPLSALLDPAVDRR